MTAVPYAARGSRRWLQILIDCHPHLFRDALSSPLRLADREQIEWRSPLRIDRFCEYRDDAALRCAGINRLPVRALRSFWPSRGPVWDALGLTSGGAAVFVEAKAHIPEAASNGTAAVGDSLRLIRRSLGEARAHYAPKATASWDRLFYQYANRLAHHYFLRVVNSIPAHLVFVYFLNDRQMRGPATADEWRGASRLIHAALGLPVHLDAHGVHEVFIDVNALNERPVG